MEQHFLDSKEFLDNKCGSLFGGISEFSVAWGLNIKSAIHLCYTSKALILQYMNCKQEALMILF